MDEIMSKNQFTRTATQPQRNPTYVNLIRTSTWHELVYITDSVFLNVKFKFKFIGDKGLRPKHIYNIHVYNTSKTWSKINRLELRIVPNYNAVCFGILSSQFTCIITMESSIHIPVLQYRYSFLLIFKTYYIWIFYTSKQSRTKPGALIRNPDLFSTRLVYVYFRRQHAQLG